MATKIVDRNTDITTLTASDISKLSTTEMAALTKDQQESFSAIQATGLTDKLLAVLQLKNLSPDIFSSIPIKILANLAVEKLSADQFNGLLPSQIAALLPIQTANLTKAQLQNIDEDLASALTAK